MAWAVMVVSMAMVMPVMPVPMRMAVGMVMLVGVIMAIMVIVAMVAMAVIGSVMVVFIVSPGRGIVIHNGPFATAALHKCRTAARFGMSKWRYLWSNSLPIGIFWKMLTFVKVRGKESCLNLWFL